MYHLIAQATSNDPGFGMDANVVVAHLTDRDVEWIEERMRQVRETPGCLSMDFQSPFNLRWGIQMVDGCRSTREMIDRVDRQNADGVEPPVETETIRINDGTFELLAIPTDRYNYQMLETDPVFLDELVAKGSLAVNCWCPNNAPIAWPSDTLDALRETSATVSLGM